MLTSRSSLLLSAVLRAATRLLLVFALLLSLGGSWHILQILAWAEMITERAPVMGFGNAVESVIAGAEPCERCIALREHRRDQERSPLSSVESILKLPPLVFAKFSQQLPIPPSERARFVRNPEFAPGSLAAKPPSPPPRVV